MKTTWMVMLAALLVLGSLFLNKPETELIEVVYTVKVGDTAWSVAQRLADRYKDTRDLREILYYTKGLDNKKYIVPGDKIVFALEVPK